MPYCPRAWQWLDIATTATDASFAEICDSADRESDSNVAEVQIPVHLGPLGLSHVTGRIFNWMIQYMYRSDGYPGYYPAFRSDPSDRRLFHETIESDATCRTLPLAWPWLIGLVCGSVTPSNRGHRNTAIGPSVVLTAQSRAPQESRVSMPRSFQELLHQVTATWQSHASATDSASCSGSAEACPVKASASSGRELKEETETETESDMEHGHEHEHEAKHTISEEPRGDLDRFLMSVVIR